MIPPKHSPTGPRLPRRSALIFSAAVTASLAWICPLAARAATLTTTPDGVSIHAGVLGEFDWNVPVLMMKSDDYTGQKAAVTVVDPAHFTATYPCGATLQAGITGSEVKYTYAKVPRGAFAFRFDLIIPLKFNQGGRFGFGDAPLAPFPGEKDKTFLHQDNGTVFRLVDSLGNGLTLTSPFGWQELADNRAFNWSVFRYSESFRFNDKDQGSLAFQAASFSDRAADGTSKYLVDRFGQVAAKSYPGKLAAEQELRDDIGSERTYLDDLNVPAVDSYGGLPGSGEKYHLKKTGFFHVEKMAGRQVFVDPEGNLFYSLGLCTVLPNDDYTLVKGREQVYEQVPAKTGEFASAWRPGLDGVLSFYVANWVRKYGQPYDLEKWSDQTITRLRRWDFNTAGAFGLETAAMRARHFASTPLLPLEAPSLHKMEGIERMYDPFAPDAEAAIDKLFAAQVAPSANDPTIIGYFLGNEQLFENIPKLVPAQKGDSPSKRRLVRLLQDRYGANIGRFNSAWEPKQPLVGFEELPDTALFVTTPAAAEDMREFLRLYLEEHYAVVTRLFRKYDANHLLLGSRWQPGTANSELLVEIAAKYMDVISVNYYTYAIERNFLDRIEGWSDGKPVYLSEWHFTSGDQGLSGDRELPNQRERGLAYRNYVENTVVIPYVIGEQWFSYLDQAATGRWFEGFNGEGANIGIINVVDRPYKDFIAECKQTNDAIYQILLGEQSPYHLQDPRFSATHAGGQKALVIPHAVPGLKMDGSTQNWPGRPPEALTPANLVMGTAEADFGASFRLCYDDENLYVIAEVKDKTPLLNPNAPALLYRGDGLELFIGHEQPREGGALRYSDQQILLGASPAPKCYFANSANQPDDVRTFAARNATADGYTLEAAIPWKDLGFKPVNGQEILFDLGIDATSDHNPEVTARDAQWMWNGSARNSSDRSQWGRARFQTN